MSREFYQNPLITRYSSRQMARVWGDKRKFSTWRRLWVALAEAQAELGLEITREQLAELRAHVDDVDFRAAERYEKELRHDVMAHISAYGDACPKARPIIHLGATSCFVTDNTDLILLRDALRLVARRLAAVIDDLAKFATHLKDMPCLGYTHLQPAQPTTVGKRACLWAHDFVLDLVEIEHRLDQLKFRGAKGATGTQASFLQLFEGNQHKVKKLEQLVSEKFDFEVSYPVAGQTYSRKIDAQITSALSGVGQSAHKMGSDLRILQHHGEVGEPREKKQVGSSAMAHKRNPMRAERMCALARFAMNLEANAAQTAAVQWMERTLDDSANRRLVLPQAFLAVDAVLVLCRNICSKFEVRPQVMRNRLMEELPFLASENVMMAGVQQGGDRQELHERIRQHCYDAAALRDAGQPSDLLERFSRDDALANVSLDSLLEPEKYIGRAPQQVEEFVREVVQPIRSRYANDGVDDVEVSV
ncbi:MAG: adenylosuccinate lyase [Planctomycetales bacterium]